MENDLNAPATKRDIVDSEERVMERLHDIETKLLNAFYGYAKATTSAS